jgi:exo-beta-1,3-glucanase (GH17 family)
MFVPSSATIDWLSRAFRSRACRLGRATQLLAMTTLLGHASCVPAQAQAPYSLYGLDFSPYEDGQSPPAQISPDQITVRLSVIAPYTRWVRTYSSLNGLDQTCKIAHQLQLKCALGVAIYGSSADALELDSAKAIAQTGYADLVIVGTEALYRGNVSPSTLINYINQVKTAAPGVPVTTADTYTQLLFNPGVMAAVDVVTFNIYPFFEGVRLEDSVAWINGWYQVVQQAAGAKQVVISETGWPSGGAQIGDAVPSVVNSASYFLDFISWARLNNVGYFYFESFDESWKISENSQGPTFGVWDKNGAIKPGMSQVLSGATVSDNWGGGGLPGGDGTPSITFSYISEIPLGANAIFFGSGSARASG